MNVTIMPGLASTGRINRERLNKLVAQVGEKRALGLLTESWSALRDKLRRARALSTTGRFTQEVWRSTQAELEEAIAILVRQMGRDGKAAVVDAASRAHGDTVRMVHKAEKRYRGVTTPLSLEQAGYLEYVEGKTSGALMRRYRASVAAYGESLIGTMERSMQSALIEKKGIDQVRSDLAGIIEGEDWRAERIVRTEVANAYENAKLTSLKEAKRDLPELKRQWVAVLDNRTSEWCRSLHGVIAEMEKPFKPRSSSFDPVMQPPTHPNCFLPGTEIQGRVKAGLEVLYFGKAINVKTKKGRDLSVTPNHPILTANGMIPAGQLRHEIDLVCYRPDVRLLTGPTLASLNKEQGPSRIDDVLRSLRVQLPSFWTSPAADDLHGDARFCEGEIDIVGPDGELWGNGYPGYSQLIHDFLFPPPNVKVPGFSRESAPEFALDSSRFSPYGIPRAGTLAEHELSFFLDSRPLQEFRFGSASNLDVSLLESGRQDGSSNSGFVGEMFHGGTGLVEFDQVAEVRDFEFRGHVYDLQSPLGWIVADNIVSSNCRCTVVPWLPPVGD